MRLLLALVFFFSFSVSFAQNRAFVIQNVWDNDLNNYNPKNFFENLFFELKNKLAVREFIGDPSQLSVGGADANWNKKVASQIVERNTAADSIYYIALTSQLKLPTVNLGKFLFKNPPRSSKLIFAYHIYNGAGVELLADTIINRGCLTNSIDEEKGNKFFYSDFSSFNRDMNCHFDYIRKQLDSKAFIKKSKVVKTN